MKLLRWLESVKIKLQIRFGERFGMTIMSKIIKLSLNSSNGKISSHKLRKLKFQIQQASYNLWTTLKKTYKSNMIPLKVFAKLIIQKLNSYWKTKQQVIITSILEMIPWKTISLTATLCKIKSAVRLFNYLAWQFH